MFSWLVTCGVSFLGACPYLLRLVNGSQAARQALKNAKDEADYREHNFQKELATSQKLAALYKEANDERSRKVTELEGVIRELQDHLKVRSSTSQGA